MPAQYVTAVTDPAAGGIDLFIGTTRNHHQGRRGLRLEYEAYVPMALAEMENIAVEAVRRWGLLRAAAVHRKDPTRNRQGSFKDWDRRLRVCRC